MNNYTIAEHADAHATHSQPPSFWSSTKVELPQQIFSFCITCIKDPITNHFLTECLKLVLKLILKINFQCRIKVIICTLLVKGTNMYVVVFRHRLPVIVNHTIPQLNIFQNQYSTIITTYRKAHKNIYIWICIKITKVFISILTRLAV